MEYRFSDKKSVASGVEPPRTRPAYAASLRDSGRFTSARSISAPPACTPARRPSPRARGRRVIGNDHAVVVVSLENRQHVDAVVEYLAVARNLAVAGELHALRAKLAGGNAKMAALVAFVAAEPAMELPFAVGIVTLLDARDADFFLRGVGAAGGKCRHKAGAGDHEFVVAFADNHATGQPLAGVEAREARRLERLFEGHFE